MSSPAQDAAAAGGTSDDAAGGAVARAVASDLASPASDDGSPDAKAHSFRERRLTYTRHHVLSDSAAAAVAQLMAEGGDFSDDDSAADEGPVAAPVVEPVVDAVAAVAERPEKRPSVASELSSEADERPRKRAKSSGADDSLEAGSVSNSVTSTPSKSHLPSRILHAGEIVRRASSSQSGRHDARRGLYSHPTHPHHHHNERGEHTHESGHRNKWRRRFSFCSTAPDHLLPFPRNVVGTYSCHGMEPVYESDYSHSDEDEEVEEENPGLGNKNKSTVAKINQDRGGIAYPYAGDARQALFAVYDGHGEGGELVSQYALTEVGRLLEGRLRGLPKRKKRRGGLGRIPEEGEDNTSGGDDKEGEGRAPPKQDAEEEEDIHRFLRETFVKVDRGLLDEDDIEPMYSGTTACVVLLRGGTLHVSNCGDSRAVLARRPPPATTSDGAQSPVDVDELVTVPLSIDQNPDSPGEEQRILLSGGYVSPPPEPGLSARVWLDPSHTQIGLAMARSIGDHAVKGVGVIAEPVVRSHVIQPEDEFMILATDGVWEFISSEDAVDIVARHLYKCDVGSDDDEVGAGGGASGATSGASVACEALIKAASEKWHVHEGDYRDDITAIVVRLKDLMSYE